MSPYPKTIVQTFDNYAKSQLTFIQSITDLAAKPNYVECLYENNVIDIVLPLVTNINPTVRMNAVLSLARLAGNSENCAKQILCSKDLLNRLLGQIIKENKYYKKSCMHLIKSLSKYSAINSKIVLKECGGINALLTCMKDFDVYVREGAMQAITSIARHDASLSQFLIDSGVLPQIISCLKEQHQNLKLCALTVLDEIAKQNQHLAQIVVEVSTLPLVMNYLSQNFTDVKVQRSALILLKNIVKHSLLLTESAIESNLFPEILLLMAHPDELIRVNAAKVICEIVKQSVQIAQLVVNNGGIASLINVISCSKEHPATPAILALGYISAMSPLLASAVIQSKGLLHLIAILKSNVDRFTKAGAIWTIGLIGQHSSEHSRSVAASDALNIMMDIYINSNLENECKHKCRTALQLILKECDDYTVFENLLTPSTPVEIMTFILNKISKILPKNTKSRRSFITNGLLKMIQNLKPEIDSELFQVIQAVNCCFPEDIIQMVAGDFPETVMKKVDKYVPENHCLFYNRQVKDGKIPPPNEPYLSGEE